MRMKAGIVCLAAIITIGHLTTATAHYQASKRAGGVQSTMIERQMGDLL